MTSRIASTHSPTSRRHSSMTSSSSTLGEMRMKSSSRDGTWLGSGFGQHALRSTSDCARPQRLTPSRRRARRRRARPGAGYRARRRTWRGCTLCKARSKIEVASFTDLSVVF
eukprot:scaffold32357_cov53-Phaeocystis_antarctica.AAC.7